ncbi:unnamed protein product [Spirodela intermedia]|uniref:Uncharacterized protein n=1 Tax=Spirodela intermedia TaxID=51605 RepID=A0A7I8LEF4_SPIIN|nr:unnamed protein product [Spirodela intermedia]
MRIVDLSSHRGPLRIIDSPTDLDCSKDVGFRRTFRSLVECMVPCCGFQASHDSPESDAECPLGSTVTGTFFGYRRGRVSFCLQEGGRSPPLLLLELSLPTAYLAREMQCGLLRIALESDRSSLRRPLAGSLFSIPVWSMYCNGRKMGFAVRRQMSEKDASIFKLMQSVSVGAGVLPAESKAAEGDLMYLRASFERVIGSADSESFHLINPVGSSGQQLSIFLLRS